MEKYHDRIEYLFVKASNEGLNEEEKKELQRLISGENEIKEAIK